MKCFQKILFCLLITGSLHAQFRKYSNEFMYIGASPRGLAMGNTVIASVDDVSAGYYNPACMGRINTTLQAAFMHSEFFAGISSFDYLGLAIKKDKFNTFGFSLIRFATDNIANTYNLIDENGAVRYDAIKEFSVADYGALFSYSYYKAAKLFKQHSYGYGGSMKIIHRTVGDFANSWGFGFDVGGIYELDDYNIISVSARDVTTTFNQWTFSFTEQQKQVLLSTGNQIPITSSEITLPRLIPAYAIHNEFENGLQVLAEVALDMTFDGKRNTLLATRPVSIEPHIGLEAGFKKIVFVRGGIGQFQQYSNDIPGSNKKITGFVPAVGAGVKLNNISIDYAFTELGNTSIGLYSHVIGIKVGVSPKKKR